MRTFALTLLVAVLPSFAADIYNFSLIPGGGDIQGKPGSTIGWGYTIENQSSTLWLVTTSLNSGLFEYGTANVLFDFPFLAPGTTVTVAHNAALGTGLQSLSWDSSAPIGFFNSGFFVLDAEWWDGDPFDKGRYQSTAPSQSASYSATVSSPLVPEPGTFLIGAFGLASGIALKTLRHLRAPRR